MDRTRGFLSGALLILGLPVAIVVAIPIAVIVALGLHLLVAGRMGLNVLESALALALRPIRERWLGPAGLALPRRG